MQNGMGSKVFWGYWMWIFVYNNLIYRSHSNVLFEK